MFLIAVLKKEEATKDTELMKELLSNAILNSPGTYVRFDGQTFIATFDEIGNMFREQVKSFYKAQKDNISLIVGVGHKDEKHHVYVSEGSLELSAIIKDSSVFTTNSDARNYRLLRNLGYERASLRKAFRADKISDDFSVLDMRVGDVEGLPW